MTAALRLPAEAAVAGARDWISLAVLALPTLLVSIDVSVMLLALPHITEGLGASSTESLWIIDVYGFMLAGFSITMGTLGDRIGRRKLLLIGGGAFALASVAAAFAPTAGLLIAARAALGIAGSIISPSILALISTIFANPRQRSFAIGIWMACFMGGMALGPLAGGALLEHFWWGSVFLMGVPVMAVLLVAGPLLLPEYRAPQAGRLDLASVALSLAAILPATYGLKEMARSGPSLLPVVAILAGIAFGYAFVDRQKRLASPLLDLSLFRNRGFTVALVAMFFVSATGAVMLFLTQYTQLVVGLSPFPAGLVMLPGVIAMMAGLLAAPLLARRIRPATLIAAGLAISIAGLLVLAATGVESGLAAAVAGFLFFNLGCAPMVALSAELVVGAAPPERAGSAGATLQTSGELAFSLGIAALGSLGVAIYRTVLALPPGTPPAAAAGATESLARAASVASTLPPDQGPALLAAARDAFIGGFHATAFVAAILLAAVALLVATQLRARPPIGRA